MPRFLSSCSVIGEHWSLCPGSSWVEDVWALDAEVLGKRHQFSLADRVREWALEDDFASMFLKSWGGGGTRGKILGFPSDCLSGHYFKASTIFCPTSLLLGTFFSLFSAYVSYGGQQVDHESVSPICPCYFNLCCCAVWLLCPWSFPGKNLKWVTISSSRGSSPPKDWTCISCISCIGRQILYCLNHLVLVNKPD